MLEKCLDNQQGVIEKLNAKVNATMQRSGETKSPINSKLCELNETYEQVRCLAQQRRNDLLDKLQQVSRFKQSTCSAKKKSCKLWINVTDFSGE